MTTTDTYEAEFLELASKPGMESLRRQCGNCAGAGWFIESIPLSPVSANAVPRQEQHWCRHCSSLGWLPLPAAERLGALVRVALKLGFISLHGQTVCSARITTGGPSLGDGEGTTPEAALTRALLAEVTA